MSIESQGELGKSRGIPCLKFGRHSVSRYTFISQGVVIGCIYILLCNFFVLGKIFLLTDLVPVMDETVSLVIVLLLIAALVLFLKVLFCWHLIRAFQSRKTENISRKLLFASS